MVAKEELDYLLSRVGKVRKWLAAIAVLKTAAICLIFASVYIGGYILLDHRLNFGILGRLAALLIFLGLTAFLVYKLSQLLLVQISFTNAANFIENNYSFNQQLVAAMEYYENKVDYPYSKALAEQLIIRVNNDSESFSFDSVVEKWRGFALATFVLLGLSIVGLYVHYNISFLKTYLARFAVPFASVDPVPATSLTTLTGDIVSEPETMIVMAAGIKGRVPETGLLVIKPAAQDSNNQEIQLRPVVESEKEPKFKTSEFFPNTGQFQYRFETGKITTQWQNIDIREAPEIKSITAEIELPEYISDNNLLKNYTEEVKNNKLELIENSKVSLHIEATSKLSKAELTEPGGLSSDKQIEDATMFTYTFTANTEGSFEFHLIDDKGLSSKSIPALKITLKTDKPPQFKLISPDGDYIATNVSSVPIEFEISDDYGLGSAEFVAEFPEGEPLMMDIPIERDSNTAKFSYVLELEKYNLEAGDSIMFYARAQDIKTPISILQHSASSGIYFIEIRPYQQIWHINSGSDPSNATGGVPEDLTTLLEYTRAIVKKTSVIASKISIDSDDRSKLDSINEDIEYCGRLLIQLRDDPQNEFTDAQKAVLNEILANYRKASPYLEQHNASEALTSEKEAYRILRKFILELEMEYYSPPSGTSIEQETPEKIELKESVEPPEMEQEQIVDELEKVQNEIEQLQAEQEELKTNLQKVLEQQKEANKKAQANSQSGEQGSNDPGSQNDTPSSDNKNSSAQSPNGQNGNTSQQDEDNSGQGSGGQHGTSSQQGQNGSGQGTGGEDDSSSQQGENSSEQGSGGQNGTSSQQGQNSTEQGGEGQNDNPSLQGKNSSTNPNNGKPNAPSPSENSSYETSPGQAIVDAQLKMLQAKQAQLQHNVSQLKQKLESIPQSSEASTNQASKEAQEHLSEAAEYMEQFQKKMDEMKYEPQSYNKKASKASDLMDSASKKLDSANNSLEKGLGTDENQLAKKLKEQAAQLAADASNLNGELTELEKEQMLARLEAANHLLESMAAAQKSQVGRGGNSNSTSANHVLTEGGSIVQDTVREISRELWTRVFELEKRQEKPIEDEPSDSRFFEAENDFFEQAAKYNSGADKK